MGDRIGQGGRRLRDSFRGKVNVFNQRCNSLRRLNIQQKISKLHTNIIFNAYSFFQIQKRATPPGKVSFEYLPLKIYVIVAKSPNLQRCLIVDLSNKTSNAKK